MDLNGKGAFKKHKTRGFQSSWLDENLFKGWLVPSSHTHTHTHIKKIKLYVLHAIRSSDVVKQI